MNTNTEAAPAGLRIARWYLIWDVQPVEGRVYTTLWTWYQVITFRSHC